MTTKLISIRPATVSGKKYTATFLIDGREKRVHFGATGYEDYTIHHDKSRRERYRARHLSTYKRASLISAAALSWHILWGESTSLRENVQNYKRML
eukprot:6178754-Pleurochrysis_carterae.AAC.2